jgi:O-antigen/teichoic acid export membrane protein
MAGCSIVIAAAATAVGPQAMRLLYGPDYEVSRSALGLLGLGVGSYLGAAPFYQGVLAIDRARAAAAIWVTAAGLFLISYWVIPAEPLERIAAGFAIATTLAAVLLGLYLTRRMRPTR